jgi:glycerol-3-phosphate acyltransferase PlsY
VLLGLFWPVVLIFAAVWLAVAWFTRYSSLAALTAAVAVPIALFAFGQRDTALLFTALSVVVFVKHHANIRRLAAGTESRIGGPKT